MAVPFMDYVDDRELLENWSSKAGDEGIKKYWNDKNQFSIDGLPTNIVDKNL